MINAKRLGDFLASQPEGIELVCSRLDSHGTIRIYGMPDFRDRRSKDPAPILYLTDEDINETAAWPVWREDSK